MKPPAAGEAESPLSGLSLREGESRTSRRWGPSRAKSWGNLTAPTQSRDVAVRRQTSRGPKRGGQSPPGEGPEPTRRDGLHLTRLEGQVQIANDPTAGSPTVTLLRLLLPLNAQVWESSRAALEA